MSDILFNKSKAVAALNKVEGFHPLELARKISNDGQEEQLYLDVKYRKLWFRLANPAGRIISRIVNLTNDMAVVEARIYLDKADTEDNYIANSFSQKFRSDDPQFGNKFLEMAETAAIGRALSDAGYGVQFADVGEENDPAQVDAGIPCHQNPQVHETMSTQQQIPAPSYQEQMNGFYHQAQAGGNVIGQAVRNPSGNPVQQMPQHTTAAIQLDASLPVEELVRRMTYEQAKQITVTGSGKFSGKTMGQIAVESPSSIQWFADSYGGQNHLIPAAARVILNQAMPMAG